MPKGLDDWDALPSVGQQILSAAATLGWTARDYGHGMSAYHIRFKDQFGNEATMCFGKDGYYQQDGRIWTTLANAPPPMCIHDFDDWDEFSEFINESLNAWYTPHYDPLLFLSEEDMAESEDDDTDL